MQVVDLMTTNVVSVRPETPLKEVARLLAEHRISGVPVVGEENKVLGVISEADFMRREGGPPHRRGLFARLFADGDVERAELARVAAVTAGAAMSSPPVTIAPQATLREAASLMSAQAVNRLPVVEDGRLVGIITRADVLDAYLQPDAELRRTIREEIVRGTMWLDPEELTIEVADGIVYLAGRVDRRSTAEILQRMAAQQDGVLAVRSELDWDLDDRDIEPVGVLHHEPGAASVLAREEPRPTG